MHPIFPALIVVLSVVLVGVTAYAATHLRFRRTFELSASWVDLDGSARRHRWMT